MLALRGIKRDGARNRVTQVDLAANDVFPVGRVGILEVCHPRGSPGIQGVNSHLAVGRAGHFDPAILQAGTQRGNFPRVILAHVPGFHQEARQPPIDQLLTTVVAVTQQLGAAPGKIHVQFFQESQGFRGEDFVLALNYNFFAVDDRMNHFHRTEFHVCLFSFFSIDG